MNRFMWLVRRELWEHRAIWIAPAVVLALLALVAATGNINLGDVDVDTAREQWAEAIGHVVTCWTNEDVELSGKHWSMPKRNVHPKPRQKPHPPIWGATSSESGHYEVGKAGIGLCSFTVGVPP